jgi:hypothetical protein
MELTAEQKTVQHAMNTMVENHLHWAKVHWNCRDMNNMLKGYKMDLGAAVGSKLPAALLQFYFKHSFLRKGLKRVKAQGFGTSTPEEMDNMGKGDMKVLSELLGEKEFMFGDEPAMLDLIVFSHLAPVEFVEADCPCAMRDFLDSDCQNLVGLINRMKDRCWGEHWTNATGEEMDLNPHIPKPVPAEPEKVEEKKEEEKKEESSEKEEKKEDEKEKADEKKEEKDKEEKDEKK